jgi:hypothetical protein
MSFALDRNKYGVSGVGTPKIKVETMSEQFVEAFVDKLVLLEQKTGARVGYRVMSPLAGPFDDCLAIQVVAKQIAESIGLGDFTFIIATAKQKEKVGGHIDLSAGGREIFVEVDSEMMKFPDAVAATLCHELCHKWLQVNGIRSPIEIEIDNEILTDIASVFLGFGKIMLNGCRTTNVRHETTPNGTRTIRETMTAGYLDRDQLAFVYGLVCAMRKIPSSDFMQGLNAEAALAVQMCNSSLGHHYAPRFHGVDAAQDAFHEFTNRVAEAQHTMADLDKHVAYIKKSLCEGVDGFLKAGHKRLESLRQKTQAMIQVTAPDPALRFLQVMKIDCEIKRLSSEVHSISQEAEGFLQHARVIGRQLSRDSQRFPSPSPTMFNIVTCPLDGTRLRLPEESGDLTVTCPKCRYRFAYSTTIVSFSEPQVPPKQTSEPQTPPRQTWARRILNLMRRREHRRPADPRE